MLDIASECKFDCLDYNSVSVEDLNIWSHKTCSGFDRIL